MKKLILSLLLIPSLILATNKIDQLEEAIGNCNVRKVKHLLKENTFSPEDKQHLLDLVNGVIEQRRSVLTLINPSKTNFLLSSGSFIGLITIFFLKLPYFASILERRWYSRYDFCEDILYMDKRLTAAFFASLSVMHISFIKHFYDYGKLWNNAIQIKYLINSIQTTEE